MRILNSSDFIDSNLGMKSFLSGFSVCNNNNIWVD